MTAAEGVQPQGHFRQFHGNGVQVYPVYIVVGDVHFYPLEFALVVLVGDALA